AGQLAEIDGAGGVQAETDGGPAILVLRFEDAGEILAGDRLPLLRVAGEDEILVLLLTPLAGGELVTDRRPTVDERAEVRSAAGVVENHCFALGPGVGDLLPVAVRLGVSLVGVVQAEAVAFLLADFSPRIGVLAGDAIG